MSLLESTTTVGSLAERISGSVVLPDDPDWDGARLAYNLTVEQLPEAVVFPEDEADVQEIVRYARANGFRVAAQRTGHNAAPMGSLEGTILLKTDRLDSVEIDADRLRARVGSGNKWEHVLPQASELGLAALHGSTMDVSIAGYGLGGGIGWYSRKHGLFTNSITAVELVTPDGELRRVDHVNDPELFWALRGGGGNFGVVTGIEFRLYAMPEVYAGILFYPWERAAEVLHAWHAWTQTVPEEMTSVGRILQFPPLEEIPEPLRGNNFVLVEAFFIGTKDEGDALLEPLRALGPALDTVALVPPIELGEMHMDPPYPIAYHGEHLALGELTPEAIDAFVAAAGPESGTVIDSAEIRHTGGILSRFDPRNGARNTFPGSYLMFAVGMAESDEQKERTKRDAARIVAALEPYRAGAYLNFQEQPVDPAVFYDAKTYRRLRAVKAEVDPDQLIRANHPIPPLDD